MTLPTSGEPTRRQLLRLWGYSLVGGVVAVDAWYALPVGPLRWIAAVVIVIVVGIAVGDAI